MGEIIQKTMILVMWGLMNIACLNCNGLRDESKFEKIKGCLKAEVLCLQETHWSDEIMDNIRKRWEGDIYVNHGNAKARGVATLIKGGRINNVKQAYKDGNGRLLVIDFMFYNEPFRLINIYAPNIETERREFFKEMKPLCKGNCIVVGDFNVWCTRLDASSSVNFKSDGSRKSLMEWMRNDDLVDVWREENPYRREFSRRQMVMGSLKQSRIDLCLTKRELLKYVKNVKYKFIDVSDHAAMIIKVGVIREERGGGVWCLNANLLKEEAYKENIVKCINYEMQNPLYKENVCEWWEGMKEKIKKRSIRYSKQRDFIRRSKAEALENALKEEAEKIENNPEYGEEGFLRLKSDLEEFEKEKSEGIILRSRAQYALEGERSTKFFLNLENKKQRRKHIVELENGKGEKINDFVGIIEEVENFYRELFKKEGVKQECVDEVLSTVNVKLVEEEKNICERDIDIEEIKDAINQTKKSKSPGSDGLIYEFYKTFIETLAPILLKVYKSMEERREMPKSMGLGIITILYKNKGSPLKLENYRPLSLLNSDYKILTKILTNRIKLVAGSIVSPSQAYSIVGRDIADIICTIRDVVESMGKDGKGGLILSVDLNKAFDRVEHSFIEQTLARYGFGERIREWIKLIYDNARSCVKINGVLTDPFPLNRSVRQGCPLSALLYSIIAEPLASLIKNDKEIRGIQIPFGGVSVIHQFADDTTFTVRDIESVKRIKTQMEKYGKASGAKINVDKSEIMSIGGVEIREFDAPFKIAKDHLKILGVNIGANVKEARDATWAGVINKIKQVLQFWKQRELRLRGKVVVANSLILTKCNYMLGAMEMPDWALNEIKEIVNTFVWGGKGIKISAKTLIADYKEGGLRLIDLEVKKKAIRVKTIKKYLCDKVEYGWKGYMKTYLNEGGGCGEEGLFMAFKKPMTEKMPMFYREVFSAWAEFLVNVNYECENINQVLNQPIFLNPRIKRGGKMLYNRLFMRAGVKKVKDLAYEYVKGFMPNRAIYDCVVGWSEDIEKEKVDGECENIKKSLPEKWVERIERETTKVGDWGMPEMYIVENERKKFLLEINVKTVYKIMVKKEIKAPASEAVWTRQFPDWKVKTVWRNLNVKFNGLDCENLDFKLRHNRIYSKVVIHQINKNVSRVCDVCEAEPETLMHIFLECKELEDFHVKIKKMIKDGLGKEPAGNEWKKLFLFGELVNYKDKKVNFWNLILSHARYAIWVRRNMAYFDRKKVNVTEIFENSVRKNVYMMWKYLRKEEFEKAFIEQGGFICIKEGLSLKF